MKRGDLVKHYNGPWYGVITRVKKLSDFPMGVQHVELIWFTKDIRARSKETIASSLLLMVSEA